MNVYGFKLFMLMLLFEAMLSTPLSAELYKTIDEEGNVIYSDKPGPGSELIESPEELNTINMPKLDKKAEEKTEKQAEAYSRFRITSPAPNETIRSSVGELTVTVSLAPELSKDKGDAIVVFIDGRSAAKAKDTTIVINNIDRGSHSVKASVVDKQGKTIIRSQTVKFHMKRQSLLHRSSTSPAPTTSTSDSTGSTTGVSAATPSPNNAAIQPGPQGVYFKPGPVIISDPSI